MEDNNNKNTKIVLCAYSQFFDNRIRCNTVQPMLVRSIHPRTDVVHSSANDSPAYNDTDSHHAAGPIHVSVRIPLSLFYTLPCPQTYSVQYYRNPSDIDLYRYDHSPSLIPIWPYTCLIATTNRKSMCKCTIISNRIVRHGQMEMEMDRLTYLGYSICLNWV